MTAGNGNGRKPRLELTWIGKDNRPRLEPRILLEQPELSYANDDPEDGGIYDNILIQGDNLLALKSLDQEYAGKVQCIYIDPPFNTQQAFDSYDDGLEHSYWLSLMRDRIELLHHLLADTGSFLVHIDDNELGYLTALTDEIFGRKNRVALITFKQSSVSGPKAINPGVVTTGNYILLYSKDKEKWKNFRVYQKTERDERYSKFIENKQDPYSSWRLISLRLAFCSEHGVTWDQARAKFAERLEQRMEQFVLANADRVVRTARVAAKDINENARAALKESEERRNEVFTSKRSDREDYYFMNGEQLVFYQSKVRKEGDSPFTAVPASNIWDDLLSNNLHAEGGVSFQNGKKPELLLKRIIEMTTEPGDIVLDSFAGSGTTGAVAHKMRRRWIMVELGEHATTHIAPRLTSVVSGRDASGATSSVGWTRGGGFRFYRLAPSLIETDQFGQRVISKQYKPEMLVEAMCKHMGYTCAPVQDRQLYWQQGYSTERDFIYVTTQSLTHDALNALSLEVGSDRTLLICCKAFRARLADFPNLTVKKIPQAVLDNCEWGRDDYSFNIATPPAETADEPGDGPDDGGTGGPTPRPRTGRRNARNPDAVAANGTSLHHTGSKKPPLRMDGTVRPSRVAKPTASTVTTPPPAPTKRATNSARQSSKTKAPLRGKQPAPSKKKRPTQSAKPAKPKTSTTTRRRSRSAADDRQGRLL